MEYLKIGTIIGTFNLDGEIKVYSTTYFPYERFQKGNTIYIKKEEEYSPLKVENFIDKKSFYILKVDLINSIDDAIKYKGFDLFIIKDKSELEEGLYFFIDLENCDIYDEKNNYFGKVIKVEEFPAQITLRVQKADKKTFFVPFIKQFIKDVDIENKKIVINVIPGMIWE